MFFLRKKKSELVDRKLTVSTHIDQLKQELESNERNDVQHSPQELLNSLVSAHLAQSGRSTDQHRK